MAQFDVYRNANRASRARSPYLLDVQSDLLDPLTTRVVVPLCKPDLLQGKLAVQLNPVFEVDGRRMVMLTPEIAGVPGKIPDERVDNLSGERGPIIAALDLLITGI